MKQPIKIESQFCITAVLEGSAGPGRSSGQDRRATERQHRVRQQGIETTRRRIAQMQAAMADFARSANELDGWIQAEQNRTGNHDPAHYAYSASATAMIQRRDALKRSRDLLERSAEELQQRLAGASVAAE
jgi:flagellar protein FliJ